MSLWDYAATADDLEAGWCGCNECRFLLEAVDDLELGGES